MQDNKCVYVPAFWSKMRCVSRFSVWRICLIRFIIHIFWLIFSVSLCLGSCCRFLYIFEFSSRCFGLFSMFRIIFFHLLLQFSFLVPFCCAVVFFFWFFVIFTVVPFLCKNSLWNMYSDDSIVENCLPLMFLLLILAFCYFCFGMVFIFYCSAVRWSSIVGLCAGWEK